MRRTTTSRDRDRDRPVTVLWWTVMIVLCGVAAVFLATLARTWEQQRRAPTCVFCNRQCPYCREKREAESEG